MQCGGLCGGLCCFALQGRVVAVAADKSVRLLNVANGREFHVLEHAGEITALAVSDWLGCLFVGVEYSGKINQWDIQTGKMIATLEGHEGSISRLAISEQRGLLFSGSRDGTVGQWDVRTGQRTATLKGHEGALLVLAISEQRGMVHGGPIYSLAISEQRGLLFSGADDGTIRQWDVHTGQQMATLKGHAGDVVCLAISEQRGLLSSGSMDFTVRLWDLQKGSCLWVDRTHQLPVFAVCFSGTHALSVSSSTINAFDFYSLQTCGVVVATTFPEPGFSVEKRCLPWLLLGLAAITRICAVCQLASCALQRRAALPRRWVPPTQAIDKISNLGVDISGVVDFEDVYLSAATFVIGFLSLLLVAGPLNEHASLHPNSSVAKYCSLGVGFAFKFVLGAGFLPLMKVLLWPLAAWESRGAIISVGVFAALCLTSATFRLSFLDVELNRFRFRRNIFDRDADLRARGTGGGALMRQRVHALSASSPNYDVCLLALRLLSLLNSLFSARLSDSGLTAASVQLILGLSIFATGLVFDPYFAPLPGGWDQNKLQNATDAGLVAIYFAALVATGAADNISTQALDSIWVTCSPLLVLPCAAAGYACRDLRAKGLASSEPDASSSALLGVEMQ